MGDKVTLRDLAIDLLARLYPIVDCIKEFEEVLMEMDHKLLDRVAEFVREDPRSYEAQILTIIMDMLSKAELDLFGAADSLNRIIRICDRIKGGGHGEEAS